MKTIEKHTTNHFRKNGLFTKEKKMKLKISLRLWDLCRKGLKNLHMVKVNGECGHALKKQL